jgi:hypothetical protein
MTVSSNLPELTWSSDGKFLYAVGAWSSGDVRVRRWSSGPAVQKIGSPFNLLSSSIDIPVKDAGGIIVGTEAPAWGVITPVGELQWRHKAPQSRHASYVGGR